jgi:hypothetical protein
MPFARDRGLAHKLVRLRGSRQVCLRERIPGTPQPAGVRPGYKRAAGFLIPPALPCSSILCAATILERNRKENHDMNRTRSAAGTAQRDRIPNLNPIGGRISTTQSNKTKIDRVSQPRKKMEPYSIGGRNSTTRSDTQPKSDWRPNQHNTIEQNEN